MLQTSPSLQNTPKFVHLRCHSEYSIVDGIVRIDDYVQRALSDNMPALALTDLSNLFGAIKFYKAARAKGLKPIIGCDIWLENTTNRDQPTRLLLLCQSQAGYLLLCQLISRAYLTNQHRGRAEFKREWFEECGTEGLIMLSGAMAGDVGMACLQGNLSLASDLAGKWQALFSRSFLFGSATYNEHSKSSKISARRLYSARTHFSQYAEFTHRCHPSHPIYYA